MPDTVPGPLHSCYHLILTNSSMRSIYYWHPHFTDEQIGAEWSSHFPKSHNHDRCSTFLIPGPLLNQWAKPPPNPTRLSTAMWINSVSSFLPRESIREGTTWERGHERKQARHQEKAGSRHMWAQKKGGLCCLCAAGSLWAITSAWNHHWAMGWGRRSCRASIAPAPELSLTTPVEVLVSTHLSTLRNYNCCEPQQSKGWNPRQQGDNKSRNPEGSFNGNTLEEKEVLKNTPF